MSFINKFFKNKKETNIYGYINSEYYGVDNTSILNSSGIMIKFYQGTLDNIINKIGTYDGKIYFGYNNLDNGIIVVDGKLVSSRLLDISYINNTLKFYYINNNKYDSLNVSLEALEDHEHRISLLEGGVYCLDVSDFDVSIRGLSGTNDSAISKTIYENFSDICDGKYRMIKFTNGFVSRDTTLDLIKFNPNTLFTYISSISNDRVVLMASGYSTDEATHTKNLGYQNMILRMQKTEETNMLSFNMTKLPGVSFDAYNLILDLSTRIFNLESKNN